MTHPTDSLRLVPRRAVYDWIRDDVPLNVKLTITPQHVDALLSRLSKAAPASPLPEGGGGMDWQSVAMWMGFSASVIKSGEPWSDQCQQHYDEAKAAFARLAAPTGAK